MAIQGGTNSNHQVTRYRAEATRTDTGWLIKVRGVRGLTIAARTLAGAEADVAEALAARLDTSPRGLDLAIRVLIPESISDRLKAALELSAEADTLRDAAATAWREVAVALATELGLSQQDAAAVMGISRQRVGQLLRNVEGPREHRETPLPAGRRRRMSSPVR